MGRIMNKPFVLLCLALCFHCFFCCPAIGQVEEESPPKTFTVVTEVWRTPFKHQYRSNACWSFSTALFLESETHRLGKGEFELSQMFIAYYAFLEKAQVYARMHGEGVFHAGGVAHDAVYIVKKYGVVPLRDYSGQLEAEQNHREMQKILKGIMDSVIELGENGNLSSSWIDGELHSRWLDDVRDVLDNHMGPVPETIEYNGRVMTPKQFAGEVLALPYDDYIEVTSYSFLPFYSSGALTIADNWLRYDGFYNVTIDDYIRILDYAFENGFSVVFDIHVTRELYASHQGYAGIDPDLEEDIIDQDARDTMLEDWSTFDQHLVHGVGIARDNDGERFYMTKDSVDEEGKYRPIDYLSENFVRAKALFFMIHKDGLPKDIRRKLGV